MIDTHCHLLPGLDDGCRDMEEALKLARALARVGVKSIVCTPHFSRRYATDAEEAGHRLQELVEAIRAVGIPLSLSLAAEVASAMATRAPAEALLARRIGSRHILVELERGTPAPVLNVVLDRIEELGCVPVLAHPERCAAVRNQPRLIDAARARGALVQIVAPSLVGRWGREAEGAAWGYVHSGRADLLASDAHRPGQEGLHLTPAIALLAQRAGPRRVVELTMTGPASLLAA
ncbi:MAG: hypothetical protein M3Z27_04360 [Actinomycetota bacterium]|nr:hypothetical protein [Actinomycetota bacterium]